MSRMPSVHTRMASTCRRNFSGCETKAADHHCRYLTNDDGFIPARMGGIPFKAGQAKVGYAFGFEGGSEIIGQISLPMDGAISERDVIGVAEVYAGVAVRFDWVEDLG